MTKLLIVILNSIIGIRRALLHGFKPSQGHTVVSSSKKQHALLSTGKWLVPGTAS